MSEDVFDALRDAVKLARQCGIRSVVKLRAALLQRGWAENTVDEAIRVWAGYATE